MISIGHINIWLLLLPDSYDDVTSLGLKWFAQTLEFLFKVHLIVSQTLVIFLGTPNLDAALWLHPGTQHLFETKLNKQKKKKHLKSVHDKLLSKK